MIFRHLLNMRSHPTWVRGLKLGYLTADCVRAWSHPTWVRGLKHFLEYVVYLPQRRTLRGCVD